MNKEKIMQIIQALTDEDETVYFDDDVKTIMDQISNKWFDGDKQKILDLAMELSIDISNLEIVKDERSDDGDHDGWEVVFKYFDEYYSVVGYYSSYEGMAIDYYDEDSWTQVKPVEVIKVRYEEIT